MDGVLNLVDRCIQLIELREKRGEAELAGLIDPLFGDFEKLHAEYLKHFSDYRDLVETGPDLKRDHPVFDRIHRDHIFARGDLGKLRLRLRTVSRDRDGAPLVDLFLAKLGDYFIYAGNDGDFAFNRARLSLIEELQAVAGWPDTQALEKAGEQISMGANEGLGLEFAVPGPSMGNYTERISAAKDNPAEIRKIFGLGYVDWIVLLQQDRYARICALHQGLKAGR